jgi:RNA polymerase sigma-70 factor, ECF subfamily
VNENLQQSWSDVASHLRGYIRTRVPDHFAAEDILQDVYLKAHTRLAQSEQPKNLEAWLFQIAKNAIVDHYRKLRRTEEVDDSLLAEDAELDIEDAEKLKASFRRMVQNLPEPYREAVILTEIEGLTQKELAGRLGISLSGAKSRVQRGRDMLKKDLTECCEFEFDARGKVIDYKPKGECCSSGQPTSRAESS